MRARVTAHYAVQVPERITVSLDPLDAVGNPDTTRRLTVELSAPEAYRLLEELQQHLPPRSSDEAVRRVLPGPDPRRCSGCGKTLVECYDMPSYKGQLQCRWNCNHGAAPPQPACGTDTGAS